MRYCQVCFKQVIVILLKITSCCLLFYIQFLGQLFRGKVRNKDRAEMVKYTCVKPSERFRSIQSSFQNVFRYDQDDHLKSINMNVNTSAMVNVEGKFPI